MNFNIGDLLEIRDNSTLFGQLAAAVASVVPIVYTGLTAAGTDQASATPLLGSNSSVQEITTVAAGTGVSLPVPVLPAQCIVINAGSNPLLAYPPLGGTIGNVASPVTINAGVTSLFVASSVSNWYQVS